MAEPAISSIQAVARFNRMIFMTRRRGTGTVEDEADERSGNKGFRLRKKRN